MVEEKEHENHEGHEAHKKNFLKKHLKNYWFISTVILAIVVVVLLAVGNYSNSSISANAAGQKVVDFAKSQGADATLVSVEKDGQLYLVKLTIQNQTVPVYVTMDGKNLLPSVIPMDAKENTQNTNTPAQTPAQAEIPKTAKPVVDAYVFSYCPYGLQFEKALFSVYDSMKNVADINIVYIGAMHGDFERVESLRQIAIQQLYGKDKLFAYLKAFDTNSTIGNCQGDAACLDKYLPSIYSKLGMDATKINNYMESKSEAIYNQEMQQAKSLGVSGSPTFMINGVQAQTGRDPESIKEAICSAFTTTPSQCSQTLSSTSASPGFGSSSGSSSGTQCG